MNEKSMFILTNITAFIMFVCNVLLILENKASFFNYITFICAVLVFISDLILLIIHIYEELQIRKSSYYKFCKQFKEDMKKKNK